MRSRGQPIEVSGLPPWTVPAAFVANPQVSIDHRGARPAALTPVDDSLQAVVMEDVP